MPLRQRCSVIKNNFNKPLRADDRSARSSSAPSPKRKLCGSMTLEAAMAVPLFLFFVMNILFLFEVVRLQSNLQAALQQAGEQICEAAYYTRFGGGSESGSGVLPSGISLGDGTGSGDSASFLLSESFVRARVTSYLGTQYLNHTCIKGGAAGLSFASCKIMTDGDRVELVVNCRVRPFVRVIAWQDFSLQSRFYGHAWVGWTSGSGNGAASTEGSSQDTVYVTRYGVVYHTDPDCIYLNPQIRAVSASEVRNLRSGDGSIYYPCEDCHPSETGTVYVTKEGNRYHSDLHCSGIVRHVTTMDVTQAQGSLRPCPKCGQTHE